MIMLTANLLPPKEKRTIRMEETRRVVILFALSVTAVLFLGSILLLPSYLPFLLEKRELERSLEWEEGVSEDLGVRATITKIRQVRSALASIRTFAPESQKASTVVNNFFEDAGPGIEIRTLTVDQSGKVVLTGSAETRRNLLEFEKALRESGRFQEVSSPLSNIIRETDISFTIQGELKPMHRL